MLVSGEAKLCGHHDIHDIHGIKLLHRAARGASILGTWIYHGSSSFAVLGHKVSLVNVNTKPH
jgi:hypothetical protein